MKNYATYNLVVRGCYAVFVLLAFVPGPTKVNAWSTNVYSGTNFFGVAWAGFGISPYTWSGGTNSDSTLYSNTNGESAPLSYMTSNFLFHQFPSWSSSGLTLVFEPVANYFLMTNIVPETNSPPYNGTLITGYPYPPSTSYTLIPSGAINASLWAIYVDSLGSNYVTTHDGYRNSTPAVWQITINPTYLQNWSYSVTNLYMVETTQYWWQIYHPGYVTYQSDTVSAVYYPEVGDVIFDDCMYSIFPGPVLYHLPLVQFYQDDRHWNTIMNFPGDTTHFFP